MKKNQIKQLQINEMNELIIHMEKQGYTVINRTTSVLKANLFGFVIIPILIPLLLLFTQLWGWKPLTIVELIVFLFALILLMVAHEFIHAIASVYYCKNKWSSVRIGILENLTPYCHCSEPLNINQYRLTIVLPLIVLGILPYFLSLLTGNLIMIHCSLIMILGASGDLLMIWLLRKEKKCACV